MSRRRQRGIEHPSRLDARQRLFVEAYLADPELDAERAAEKAGYVDAPKRWARRLMQNPAVKAAIEDRIAQRMNRLEIDQDYVLKRLMQIADADPRRAFHPDGRVKSIHELDDDLAAALQGIDSVEVRADEESRVEIKKLRLWDKLKALELLGKHLAMFTDRVEATRDTTIVVIDPYAGEAEDDEEPPEAYAFDEREGDGG